MRARVLRKARACGTTCTKVTGLFSTISRVGQNHIYIRCIYGIFGRGITKYTIIYGAYIQFWPTLNITQSIQLPTRPLPPFDVRRTHERFMRARVLRKARACGTTCTKVTWLFSTISRVGQNHIYTVHIRYFWQGNHQIYGHIRCIYTVLANPNYITKHSTAYSHSLLKFLEPLSYSLRTETCVAQMTPHMTQDVTFVVLMRDYALLVGYPWGLRGGEEWGMI